MCEAKMGAKVLFCGHEGWFVGDVHRVGNVNVVRAAPGHFPVTGDSIIRRDYKEVTHCVSDCPVNGFWRPDIGVFVVPEDQVTEIKPGEIRKWLRAGTKVK